MAALRPPSARLISLTIQLAARHILLHRKRNHSPARHFAIVVWVPRVFDNRFVSPQMVRDGSAILTGILAKLRPDVSPKQAVMESGNGSIRIELTKGLSHNVVTIFRLVRLRSNEG